jgi:hypothetical protein
MVAALHCHEQYYSFQYETGMGPQDEYLSADYGCSDN